MTGRTELRRVLLYSHDTYGLGHLRRNLAIARRLVEQRKGLQVVLMTGSPVADRFELPAGLSLVRLPPVVKVGAERYEARDGRFAFELVRRARSAIMLDTARRLRPDVLLVDHAPQGMKGELLSVFEGLRSASPATRIVLGLRDVLDAPETVRGTWREQGAYETIGSVYDHVLVYGDADLFDVVDGYALPAAVAGRLTYCGYVCPPRAALPPVERRDASPFVLGTAGGGGDGGQVLEATLQAACELGVPALLVTGPLMSEPARRRLAERAERAGRSGVAATVTEFVADLAEVMGRAAAVVAMGGYNTLCELVASGAPAVVVPRVEPRREQAIRAGLFARRGAVRVVEPGGDLAARLTPVVADALAAGPRRGDPPIPLDGLDRVDAAVELQARLVRSAPLATAASTP